MKSFVLIICVLCTGFCEKLFNKRISFNKFNGLIGAFGDFDLNMITDVFLITQSGRAVELAEGHRDEPYLRMWPNCKTLCNISCEFAYNSSDRIVGVIPSPFTGAQMDLLVVTQDISLVSDPINNNFKLWLFKGNKTSLECNTITPLAENVKSFPLILDFNGDMISDFIVETDNCLMELWMNSKTECLRDIQTNQRMNYPNSNAFIDLSNPKDFSPDLYISGSDSIEYWFNNKGFDAKNNLTISYPNSDLYKFRGQSTFADINFDGVIEHIIPVCKSDIDTCEEPQILVLFHNGSDYEWIELLDTKTNSNLTFTQIKLFDNLDFFVTLRVGDIDLNGFPDFVTVMRDRNSSETRAVWLKNRRSKSNKFGRKFEIQLIGDDTLLSATNGDQHFIDLASIFDFNEDGILDIIIGSHDLNNSLFIDAYINNGESSANFLKVQVTTGICSSDCPEINAPLVGPFLCFSPSAGRQVSCAGQMSQTAHFALQLPFVLFGLGDISNFIENLSVSIPSGRRQTWYEMIPDSRVIIIPYPANHPDDWVQKLYLDPKYFAFPTLISLTTICCILVIIIAILHKRDLRRDIIEHKEYRKHWL